MAHDKGVNSKELPLDRLATTDERGRRVHLYPAEVKGRYRRRRYFLSALLLLVFLVLPFIKIGGHPAVLLDIPNRRFALFGLLFWAHEAPMLVFVTGAAILALALVTAVWGRVWCGWACPQTVFVDTIFRRIENWIEGDSLARRKLDESPWNGEKTLKKGAKWGAFTVVSLLISHSFIAYFVGPDELGRMVRSSPAQSPGAFAAMLGMFALVMFDFGWFREQFCTLVCPYGRFQSVLMDEQSQVVAYQGARGEPRRGSVAPGQTQGDCVNCYRCVQVCPTGIDIRRGLQLECIACTACIDACDDVMTRLKKPVGLIKYSSEKGASPRVWIYAALLAAVLGGLTITLVRRNPVEVELIRAPEAPYQELAGGRVINHYKVHLRNQTFEDVSVELSAGDSAGARARDLRLVVSNHAASLPAGKSERADLFIDFPKSILSVGKGSATVTVTVRGKAIARSSGDPLVLTREVRLVGPYR